MEHDLFLSYSHKDKKVADVICRTLENRGIRCWLAPRDILPGDSWASSIVNAITNSRVFVLIFSSHANSSDQVLREVERAVGKSIPIIPFRIEEIQLSENLEYYLSATHWLDAFTLPLETHVNSLCDAVERMLSDSMSRHPAKQPSAEKSQFDVSYKAERISPTIKVLQGPFKDFEKKMSGESFSIGRNEENNFCIRDIFVSSKHCLIKLTEQGVFELFDKSSNGTWINGKRIQNRNVLLRSKSTIGVGPVLFLFELK